MEMFDLNRFFERSLSTILKLNAVVSFLFLQGSAKEKEFLFMKKPMLIVKNRISKKC